MAAMPSEGMWWLPPALATLFHESSRRIALCAPICAGCGPLLLPAERRLGAWACTAWPLASSGSLPMCGMGVEIASSSPPPGPPSMVS